MSLQLIGCRALWQDVISLRAAYRKKPCAFSACCPTTLTAHLKFSHPCWDLLISAATAQLLTANCDHLPLPDSLCCSFPFSQLLLHIPAFTPQPWLASIPVCSHHYELVTFFFYRFCPLYLQFNCCCRSLISYIYLSRSWLFSVYNIILLLLKSV